MAEGIDEFTLLCESCGYSLAGLPTDGNCPECGVEIAESLPAVRVGSAWQVQPATGSWVSTCATTLRRPRQFFRRVRIEQVRSSNLLMLNAALGCIALLSMPLLEAASGVAAETPTRARWAMRVATLWLLYLCVAGVICWAGTVVLTLIEYAGVQFFGGRSRWRISPAVAWTVCGHASVGWLVGGLLTFVAWLLGWLLSLTREPWQGRQISLAAEIAFSTIQFSPVWGFFIGLLTFETLVYIGIRQCRFANRMPPHSPPSMATDRDSHAGKGTEPRRGDPAS